MCVDSLHLAFFVFEHGVVVISSCHRESGGDRQYFQLIHLQFEKGIHVDKMLGCVYSYVLEGYVY